MKPAAKRRTKQNKSGRTTTKLKTKNQDPKLSFSPQHAANALVEMTKEMTTQTKLYFVLGSLFLVTSVGWHFNQTIQLMFFTPKVVPVQKIYAVPTEIKIPKVAIDLPIEQTAINNGTWQVSEKGASHLTISARPGEKGTIIMYSHNTNERFGPIRWLSKGDSIQIKSADGKTHTYKVTETMTIAPNKMDVLTQKRGEALLLYTCDGFADLQRFVLIATPDK